ncbi:MAG: HD domain-containing phosphohydrolase [Gammaproteobacteria bacterium]
MKKKVLVGDLAPGMYVYDLDRPWIETPFLFQGFSIDSYGQIKELKEHCEYVYIDVTQGIDSFSHTNKTESTPAHTDPFRSPLQFSGSKHRPPAKPIPQDVVIYQDKRTVKEELGKAQRVRRDAEEMFQVFIQDICSDRVVNLDKVKSSINDMVESIVRNPDALLLLTQLKDKDNPGYGRAIDASVHMLAFGRHLGFPKEQLPTLGIGGLLQDIGNLRLPGDLLRKKESLTQEEYKVVQAHVEHSLSMLTSALGIDSDAIEMVATHHERQDGSGYPNGLTAEYIGTYGNMAGIVDTFLALTRERPYAEAVPPREALELMLAWRGKYLHGGLMERFIQCIGFYPVGSLVELNSGEVAVVLAQNRVHHFKPKIILILDANKKPYMNPLVLNLSDDPKVAEALPYRINKSLKNGMYGIDPKEYYL